MNLVNCLKSYTTIENKRKKTDNNGATIFYQKDKNRVLKGTYYKIRDNQILMLQTNEKDYPKCGWIQVTLTVDQMTANNWEYEY